MSDNVFYGQRLRTARNFFGYSLEEVGQKVGTTRQYIHKLENSTGNSPAADLVDALAGILETTSAYFYKPEVHTVADDQCHFRKLHATTVSVKNQALAHGTVFAELSEHLGKIISFPKVNFYHKTPESFAQIEEIAEASRSHWGLGLTAPIKNMTRVVENAGALVTQFAGVSDKVDAFSMHRKRPLIIRNPAKQSACRLRFDIAHECGHIVMHQGILTGDKETEDQANRFASAFLLPRKAFSKEYPRAARIPWKAIYEMKLRWKVAASAIVRRAYDLGLMDAVQYRIACVHLRKTGEMKQEQYDDRYDLLPLEEPEVIKNAFNKIMQDAPHLLPQLLSKLNMKQEFLEKLVNTKLSLISVDNVVSISDFNKLKFTKTDEAKSS